MSSPERPIKIPGPDHPITVEPSTDHVTVTAGAVTIAETDSALQLQEATYPVVYYLPPDSANWDVLQRTDSHTYCPYKGEATYYTVLTPDGPIVDAVWTYENPYPAVADIVRHLAFYPDRVTVSAG